YQYTPKLIHAISSIIAFEVYPVVLGSRILGHGALKGGMPMYKYIFNRCLTLFENIVIGQKLSEYHTGYRAFSGEVIRSIDFSHNSDDFVFDNEMLSQVFMNGYDIAEVTCPTKYFEEASSINFSRSMKYGMGVLRVSMIHRLHKWGLIKSKLYNKPE
ncbi:MAG: glycosyltransferase family 2 protein, partial [Chitinophagaceae bacterium]|nr:glycosyltransferase family 2 protein [Chitinophagaceae bacterium]